MDLMCKDIQVLGLVEQFTKSNWIDAAVFQFNWCILVLGIDQSNGDWVECENCLHNLPVRLSYLNGTLLFHLVSKMEQKSDLDFMKYSELAKLFGEFKKCMEINTDASFLSGKFCFKENYYYCS